MAQGLSRQQEVGAWNRALVGRDKKREKKNQRIQHLNANKGFEERGLGTLLWAVGSTEEDGEGPLLHVDGDKHIYCSL